MFYVNKLTFLDDYSLYKRAREVTVRLTSRAKSQTCTQSALCAEGTVSCTIWSTRIRIKETFWDVTAFSVQGKQWEATVLRFRPFEWAELEVRIWCVCRKFDSNNCCHHNDTNSLQHEYSSQCHMKLCVSSGCVCNKTGQVQLLWSGWVSGFWKQHTCVYCCAKSD